MSNSVWLFSGGVMFVAVGITLGINYFEHITKDVIFSLLYLSGLPLIIVGSYMMGNGIKRIMREEIQLNQISRGVKIE